MKLNIVLIQLNLTFLYFYNLNIIQCDRFFYLDRCMRIIELCVFTSINLYLHTCHANFATQVIYTSSSELQKLTMEDIQFDKQFTAVLFTKLRLCSSYESLSLKNVRFPFRSFIRHLYSFMQGTNAVDDDGEDVDITISMNMDKAIHDTIILTLGEHSLDTICSTRDTEKFVWRTLISECSYLTKVKIKGCHYISPFIDEVCSLVTQQREILKWSEIELSVLKGILSKEDECEQQIVKLPQTINSFFIREEGATNK